MRLRGGRPANIPDPIERSEAAQERLMWQWEETQGGLAEGSYRCPCCHQIFTYEPIQINADPASPVSCYDCLPAESKKAYDEFERRLAKGARAMKHHRPSRLPKQQGAQEC